MDTETALTRWNHWYELARLTLGYEHDEAVEYANLRLVEEQNRESFYYPDTRAGAA